MLMAWQAVRWPGRPSARVIGLSAHTVGPREEYRRQGQANEVARGTPGIGIDGVGTRPFTDKTSAHREIRRHVLGQPSRVKQHVNTGRVAAGVDRRDAWPHRRGASSPSFPIPQTSVKRPTEMRLRTL
jgi:hypothetical protein